MNLAHPSPITGISIWPLFMSLSEYSYTSMLRVHADKQIVLQMNQLSLSSTHLV
jgi:hypothetical protein